jgi:hypothetical protein
VRSGGKGDVADWRIAEDRWTKEGINLQDLKIATFGIWFDHRVAQAGAPSFTTHGSIGNKNSSETTETASQLFALCQSVDNPSIKRVLAQATERFILSVGSRPSKLNVQLFLEACTIAQSDLFDNGLLGALPKDEWKDHRLASLLEQAAAQINNIDDMEYLDLGIVLRAAFEFHPNMRELLYPLAAALFENEQIFVEAVRSFPASTFIAQQDDPPRTRIAASILHLARTGAAVDTAAVLGWDAWNSQHPSLLSLLRPLLLGEILPLEKRLSMLTELIKSANGLGGGSWRGFVVALHRALDARKSGLSSKEIWVSKLKLPEDSFSVLLPAGGKA